MPLGSISPVRFLKLSSGNGAFVNSTTSEVIVLQPGAPGNFSLGPQPASAWQTAQQMVTQNQAVLLSPADLAALQTRTGVVPMLSGPGPG